MNQCWNIANWNIRNKLQWNLNRKSDILIPENAFENVVCEMTAMLSRPLYVKKMLPPYVFRFQICYGQHWAPKHPGEPTQGVLTEILLGPDDVFINLTADAVLSLNAMQFTTSIKTYPWARVPGASRISVPLNGILYFSGVLHLNHMGVRVSQLAAHRETCHNV